MRYSVPARYARFLEASIVLAIAEAAQDQDRRSDDDPRIRAWAKVPESLIDPQAEGEAIIVVDVPDAVSAIARVA